jgi:Uma2 family endonuclease
MCVNFTAQPLSRGSTDMLQTERAELPTPSVTIHRLSVAQYDAMGRAGILSPDERVELLEGWLVEKMTKNPPHRIATRQTRLALESVVPDGWYVETQEPIVTGDSEPEPDVAVIRGRTQDYETRNPPASQVGLVVEIADTTVERDRLLKARVYARAGIPAYWLVNLAEHQVEVYADPQGEGATPHYATRTDVREGDVPVTLDNVEVGRVSVHLLLGTGASRP